jgi:iron complex outermembrane receptor protein
VNGYDLRSGPRPACANVSRWLISAAVATAIWGAAAQPARAQDQTAQPAGGDQGIQEVTVTGSRIARSRDLEAPSPITTISMDQFETSGSTGTESVLNQLPQFVPTNDQFTNGIQASPTVTPGSANLNLRGLGTNRNLVLIDGRRPEPGSANLAVDVNTIPTLAIKSVEVITGGASAVYGPDAIAGVVNYVLKDDFQGLDVDVQRMDTEQGGGAETRVSMLMGMNGMDGRGNIMLGVDWTKREPVLTADRNFYSRAWLDPGDPSGGFLTGPAYEPTAGNQPTQAAVNALFPQAPGGTVGTGTQINFAGDGSPYVQAGGLGYDGPLNSTAPGRYSYVKILGPNTSSPGALDQAYSQGWVSTPLERHSFYGRGTFNFNDSVSFYTDVQYANVSAPTQGLGYPPALTIWQTVIPRYANDNTWLPAALVSLLNSRPNPQAPWQLYQSLDFNGPEITQNTTDEWQITAGLKGKLDFRDWTWDVYVSRGQTRSQQDTTGLPSLQRLQYLEGLPDFGKGANVSAPAGTPFGYGESCPSGLPVFQQFTPDPLCLQSIEDPLKNESNLRQDILEGNVTGALLPIWAGDVRYDLGAAYRTEDYSFSPGNPVAQIADNPVGLFPSNYTNGETNVKEVYTELLVPIVKRLDLELGYRFSDFNTAGGTNTWKALFTWKPLDSVSFRGGVQSATRAPNVAELFTGPIQNVVPFPMEDPCSASTLSPWGNVPGNPNRAKVQALCEALIGNMTSQFNTQTYNAATYGVGPNGWTRQVPTFFPLEIEVDTGNPKVKPETGRTWTFGTVISEPFGVSRLTATVDYYHIRIADTIAPESSITVYNNCFNSDGASNPTYSVTNASCQLISRDPITGDRASVVALYTNLGTLQTAGIDLNINWAHDLGPGTIAVGTAANYLIQYEYQTQPGGPFVDAKGTLDPVQGIAGLGGLFEYRTLSHVQYTWGNLTAGMTWEHLSSIHAQAYSTDPTSTVLGEPAYNLYGLFGNYNFGKFSVRFGVENLFNKDPLVVGAQPGVTTASGTTNPGFYDPLGRRFYVGAKASF